MFLLWSHTSASRLTPTPTDPSFTPPPRYSSAPWHSPRLATAPRSSLSSQWLACDKMHDGSLPSRPSSAGGDALKQKRSVMYARGLPHTHKHTDTVFLRHVGSCCMNTYMLIVGGDTRLACTNTSSHRSISFTLLQPV